MSSKTAIVDTSFIMDMRARPTAESDVIATWVVSDGVINELTQHVNNSDEIKKERAEAALDVLNTLQVADRLRFVADIGNHGVDDSLVAVAARQDLPLLTLDHEMRQHANEQGVYLLPLDEINGLSLPLHVGSHLRVKIDSKGRRKHQGVVEHALGTIYVDNAAEVGSEHTIVITEEKFEDVSVILFAQVVD